MASHLELLDVCMFVSVVLISILIGLYFTNRNKTMSEYMLGSKSMGVLPVAMSMMTSFMSGVTMVSTPYEIYSYGWYYTLCGTACLVCGPIAAYLILPVFYKGNYLSIYEYLEERFSKNVRTLVSILFMLQMLIYNAMVLYVPSLALQAVTGIDKEYLIMGVGLACSIYCTLGGIKAVIWTDLLQGSIMLISLLTVCVASTINSGGFFKIWSVARENGRLSGDDVFKLDLSTRYTIFNVLTGNLLIQLYMNAASQIQIQRSFCLPTLKKAQMAFLLSMPLCSIVYVLASYTGLIVYYKYAACDPIASGDITRGDAILPLYIVKELNNLPGLCGLFIAGIFSATLSTLSSFANSLAAITMDDYIRPVWNKPISDKSATLTCKFLAFSYCIICVLLSFVVDQLGNLLETALTLFATIGTPFLATFLLGMHTKFCNTIGITCGILVAVVLGLTFQVCQQIYAIPFAHTLPISSDGCTGLYNQSYVDIHNAEPTVDAISKIFDISYLWVPVMSLITTVVVSCLVSLLTGGRRQHVNEKCLHSYHKKKIVGNGQDLFL